MGSSSKTILISGASGFVGSSLKADLAAKGHAIRELSRKRSGSPGLFVWDPAKGDIDPAAVSGSDIIIHLAGESISSLPWTKDTKRRIRESRVLGTTLISDAAAKADKKPGLIISASAVGFYGSRGDEVLAEDAANGAGFLAEVARAWESATRSAEAAGIRVIHLRIGIVLGKEGGILKTVAPPFRLGLGGPLGNGGQYMSWISLKDLIRAIGHLIESPALAGAFNLTAPTPCTNLEFTKALGRALHRPALIPAPAFILRLLLRDFADEVLLGSTRAIPKRLMDSGFSFEHGDLDSALSWAFKS